jgi:ABC-type molybdenum transport system ATPase subunit/photorepair protein PhrA
MIFDLKNVSYIGKTVFGGDFGIPQNDRRRHLHIVGQTGTGKSTTLLHLLLATGPSKIKGNGGREVSQGYAVTHCLRPLRI